MWYTILHLLYSILYMWYTIPRLWYINTEQYTAFVVQYTTYVVYISEKIEANFKNVISTWNFEKNLTDSKKKTILEFWARFLLSKFPLKFFCILYLQYTILKCSFLRIPYTIKRYHQICFLKEAQIIPLCSLSILLNECRIS